MPPKLYHFRCKHCNKARQTYDASMQFCTSECQTKFKYYEAMCPISATVRGQKARLKNHILKACACCGQETSRRKFCSDSCHILHRAKLKRDATTARSKEKFLEDKKRKGVSFEELNRQAEWRRVFDDDSWLNRFYGRRM